MTRITSTLATLLVLVVSGSVMAHPGIGIVEDSKGNIYYTDLSQVWRITPDGKKTMVVPHVHTHELFMDASDNLYGEHLWYNGDTKGTWGHYVWRRSANGTITKVVNDTEGFRESFSFVQDKSGNMFWADRNQDCQKVIRKPPGGTGQSHGSGCYHNIRNMYLRPDGKLVVVDFQNVILIDPDGSVKVVAKEIAEKGTTKSSVHNQNSVMGVWADDHGNIYAAVPDHRLVRKIDALGKESSAYKTSFPWAPSGGMIDHSGNLWVLEFNAINQVRVERVSTGGKATSF